MQEEAWHLYTTAVILAEAHVLILRELRIKRAAAFLSGVYASPATTVEPLSTVDEQRAIELLQQYEDKSFSFADAIAFAVSERIGFEYAFSFDRHFHQYGQLLILDSPHSW